MPQHTGLQIFYTAEVVHDFPGKHILHQGIEGEIPATGSRLGSDEGIHKNVEILMALAPGLFFAGHGDVQIIAF